MIETTDTRIPVKRWVTGLDEGTERQIRDIANLSVSRAVAIMPDAHVGYGMPIGGVLAVKDAIIPNAVGVDIGCGMLAVRTNLAVSDLRDYPEDDDALKRLMGEIRKAVPVGFAKHKDPQAWDGFERAPDIGVIQRELQNARVSLGTLGGGNHFIEIQADEAGVIWLMLHSGSRNFGLRIATEYHTGAQAVCKRLSLELPNEQLAYLPIDSVLGQEYLAAMTYAVEFAEANRAAMMRVILADLAEQTGGKAQFSLDVRHNYAAMQAFGDETLWVHRKGAVFAGPQATVIIPGSMGSPSYIAHGLGNPDSLMSCSHGAGRRMGRGQAKRELNLDIEIERMKGIVHGLRTAGDLDEAPGAYKPIDEVMAAQADLVSAMVKLRPLASIKG